MRLVLRCDEHGMSPIIATVLLTATVMVLAAGMFVLVADFSGDAEGDAPRLSLFSDSGTRSTAWLLKVGSATRDVALTDYEFVHTTPTAGTIVYRVTDDSTFTGGSGLDILSGDLAGKDGTSLTSADPTTTKTPAQAGYRLRIQDISGDDLFTTADTIQLTYDSTDADGAYDQQLPTGLHRIELRHTISGAIAGSVSNAF